MLAHSKSFSSPGRSSGSAGLIAETLAPQEVSIFATMRNVKAGTRQWQRNRGACQARIPSTAVVELDVTDDSRWKRSEPNRAAMRPDRRAGNNAGYGIMDLAEVRDHGAGAEAV